MIEPGFLRGKKRSSKHIWRYCRTIFYKGLYGFQSKRHPDVLHVIQGWLLHKLGIVQSVRGNELHFEADEVQVELQGLNMRARLRREAESEDMEVETDPAPVIIGTPR